MNYLDLPISTLHELILKNEVSPEFLVKTAIFLAKNDKNNAFEYISEDYALRMLARLNERKKDSIFYGIPIVIKDNFSTKDIPTTASSKILEGYVPIFSAEVVDRLEEAGAIIIGKATLDELAMGGTGASGHKGATYNPWDESHKRMIGGSSCGSAATVSAGIVPFSLGSDTGDSVRKPASYSALVGFKPTWGRISRFGLFQFASSLDHVAYFTRNVFDSAASLNVLAGRDDKDFSSSFKEVEDYTKDLTKSLKGKRIAVINQIFDSVKSETIKKSFKDTILKYEEQGAVVDFVDMDINLLKMILPTYLIISSAESTSNNACLDGIKFGNRVEGESFKEVMTNTRTEKFSSQIKRRFVIGSFALLAENQEELFVRAQRCRRLIVNAFNRVLETYDAIYCPASSSIAPFFEKKALSAFSNVESPLSDDYLAFGNMGGYPSITIPIGFENDMPFGANLTCKPFNESLLFNLAYQLEKITGLHDLVAPKKK